ncbi:purine/pyrimidine permease [Paenibacillus sp. MER 99-2]|uniref:purine/pyrimidine permease n=1 Tax=Paenibacillus sp. MER 99-2 TaxID=2939572 RepID=UPI002042407C|nr:purine/pyrimidine permease [Paenibacillus sp. MER 99-2]
MQWLFFLFTNTVVIPITVGAAFALPQDKIQFLIQCSFVLTGLACVVQAAFGHQRSVMEGQSGLWWGVILSLSAAAPSLGISLTELGGSLAAGIVISGIITILIGVCGLASPLSKLFTPGVMAVFMFLLGCRLNMIFLEGMLGIFYGSNNDSTHRVSVISSRGCFRRSLIRKSKTCDWTVCVTDWDSGWMGTIHSHFRQR